MSEETMIIWRIRPIVDEFIYIALSNDAEVTKLPITGGKPLLITWEPLKVDGVGDKTLLKDFPVMSGGLVCSERARNILLEAMSPHVEFLPLTMPEMTLFFIHVLSKVNCLDLERSELEYFRSGTPKSILRWEFKRDCIEAYPIFCIPERGSETFISNDIKVLIEQNELEGLSFIAFRRGKTLCFS